ncbi:MAG TPA: helix-turn-helix transcriptional regulator [Gemmatimonadaceae bacterium]|jgi:predicted XRE-type DNA-binding protein|nr:helix-turn-helix transcriptional regulator [Gemmatimonadaceae bacterium]
MDKHRKKKPPAGEQFDRGEIDGITFTDGGDNVFADLGLSDADDRLAKAEMAREIRRIVETKGWNQRRAAKELGIAAPDVSDLFRGKLKRFSQERLERFLNALDIDVRIVIGPRPSWKPRAGVSVQRVTTF